MPTLDRRAFLASAASAGILPFLRILPAEAQERDTLVTVFGQTINSLDLHRVGTNRASYQVAINCYDRLVGFGAKQLPSGEMSYDYDTIVPELAESWTISDDGLTITFKLKPDATFWDGTKVTAEDVKWSFDRAVLAGGFPSTQMRAGGFFRPDQFEAVDEETFVVRLDYPSKLSLPNLAVPVPFIINSKVAKANATGDDPWAMEYLHMNPAGSGAYKVARWDQGQQLVYERNDAWVGGELPAIRRVIVREVPSAATRRALVERGDVQISMDIPDRDAAELADSLTVHSTPIENCMHCLCLNSKFAPFQDANVRKAVAYAVPYEAIFESAAYGRGARLWGGPEEIDDIVWPRPFPYDTNLDTAREYLAQSGYPDGFEVTLSISLDLVDWMEPTALLIQEALGRIGITVTVDRIPGANWRTVALVDKSLDLHLENFGGWLNTPCYYFFWAYQKDRLFNSSAYDSEAVHELTERTLHMAMDDPEYAPLIKQMFAHVIEDLPRIPLYQPALNVAMNGAGGYEFWFHRQLDIRPLNGGEA
ncbi:MAG: peptide/nickel transport system substrate-binding protein [Saliniramus fredricksonii]|uniref:Peptide/nickel transport system substrate-binding protein n=1 Tax=Saliniramus fredricksonii TaxID=1653334 RepID=A0A0P7XVT5_9HYPH|nr:ABC transporter substrate-binding protein [Saliniramus fredricksonii]KPQ11653.1 MAG: peptide/nickel transport system substrate-binding protein [Saliniramus fredricksonii]SCC80295.1 peptide/nickel transport system substrate-binding protein [Saliniramus fredricksonii]